MVTLSCTETAFFKKETNSPVKIQGLLGLFVCLFSVNKKGNISTNHWEGWFFPGLVQSYKRNFQMAQTFIFPNEVFKCTDPKLALPHPPMVPLDFMDA